jgi:pyrimidine-nucleoside phosphorylase
MAAFLNGLDERETADLTMSMVNSGKVVDLSSIPGIKVDKHSTGGVGDTTTLVLAPLVAAAGVPVAKMSGRALGHTGGTLDKLESIPGLSVNLTDDQFLNQVKAIGVAVVGQTEDIAPADKKIYALRDVTATIDSMSLIAASIMSKKIAAGSDAIVLDVKTGSGAFMCEMDQARQLACTMAKIGNSLGRRTVALITDMDQPLGDYVGNALEVHEAIEILNNKKSGPLRDVSLTLGAHMLVLGGKAATFEEGRAFLDETLTSGAGALKLKEMIKAQCGNPCVVDDPGLLPQAALRVPFRASAGGYLQEIRTTFIGRAANALGAGRRTKEESIDHSVGLIMKKRRGDAFEKGEVLVELMANGSDRIPTAMQLLEEAFIIGLEPPEPRPLILDFIC